MQATHKAKDHEERIKLNVGGRRFETTLETLTKVLLVAVLLTRVP